tara:strand:- start:369 stop:1694 length:1326 start_codon:yes stop_codon:yes gene_type:complete
MFQLKKLSNLENFTNFLLSLIPISLIAGSLVVNLNIISFVIAGTVLIRKKGLALQINKIKLFFSAFFIFIIISSIINFSIVGQENIIKSIFLLRFLVLYFIIEILLVNNLLSLRKLFTVSLICTSFVSIDLLIQYTFGKNILGYEPINNYVLSGVFFDEAIAGGYIQKLFLLSLLSLIIFSDEKKFSKTFIIPVVLIHTVAIFVSTNKMPFVLILFSILLLILFFKELRINLTICLILSIFASIVIAKNDANLNQRYKSFYSKIFGTNAPNIIKDESIKDENEKLSELNFFSQGIGSEHGLIYFATFESFKNNMIIGNGLKSIRSNCAAIIKAKIPGKRSPGEMCLPHPHNFHLEILNDAGLLGYLFIAFFVILTFLKSLKNYYLKTTLIEKSVFILILVNFFIEIWPIKSTGSLFSTWTGSTTWLIVALTSYNLKNNKLK